MEKERPRLIRKTQNLFSQFQLARRYYMVTIDPTKCTGCGGCIDLCPQIAISMINDVVTVNKEKCNECAMCIKVCPMKAPMEVE
jgi:ferredoxin